MTPLKIKQSTIIIPLVDVYIQCGFPSPAQDYMEEDIDLQKLLIQHPLATFLIRARGDSMNKANIPHGSILLVDKSLTHKNRDIVVAYHDGGFNVKRLIKNKTEIILSPESYNPIHKQIVITEEMNCIIWGVVIQIIIDPKFKY